ncbi:DNA topoisomerase 3 [Paraburkholderia sp. BL21I4N1]|uniref:DNA topoisomerase 3 n=1 Tax=Paraburkholderia sp. BL21I4N1 TaxID=1938801 RepID=UPI000CFBBB77|nr:DNA topoisomerase 3 [Paraburkholderia sp. BL21I4N1]PQV44148.1 DNA topoisomerase-3 [Paraburkholderia sp. BL21I4N1]
MEVGKKLYICEKPSQAKDLAPHAGARGRAIGAFTGDSVTVTWCIGHLLEQAKPEQYVPALTAWKLDLLPVLPQRWAVQVRPSVKKQFDVVVRLVKQADEVVIATDADREGEVIAREVMQIAGYRGPVSRLWLSAMDAASIRRALAQLLPGQKTLPLYYSGLGRAHADWLAGMNLTMALTAAFGTGGKDGTLHVGRVQTPVLALIVRRERAIRTFVPKPYFDLASTFDLAGKTVSMQWIAPAALLDQAGHAIDAAKVKAVAGRVQGRMGKVVTVETTPEREAAPLPFSLGSLQREASARHGLKAAVVLDACQALYETHKATTYPRTDCQHLPVSMFDDAPEVVAALAAIDPGLAALASRCNLNTPGRAFNDAKVTAHHAIIPTANSAVKLAALTKPERLVYDLIRRRYLAQFLGDFGYLRTIIEVMCEGELFRVTGKTPQVNGWCDAIATEQPVESPKTGDAAVTEVSSLPAVSVDGTARNLSCDVERRQTRPPARYTEGTLLAAMESIDREIDDGRLKKIIRTKEKAGIGTDATRAGIIESLFRRDYIGNDAKRKKQIVPLSRGEALVTLLERVLPELADPVLTAEWEERLLRIESEQLALSQFETDLGVWITALVERISEQRAREPASGPSARMVACPSCGAPMRRIKGSRGWFWGCTAWRDGCRSTLPDVDGTPGNQRSIVPGSELGAGRRNTH